MRRMGKRLVKRAVFAIVVVLSDHEDLYNLGKVYWCFERLPSGEIAIRRNPQSHLKTSYMMLMIAIVQTGALRLGTHGLLVPGML